MEGYGYPYSTPFPPMEGDYPDHGDGLHDYYGMTPINEERELSRRPSRSRHRINKRRNNRRSRSRTISDTRSRSRSRTHTGSQSKSGTRSRTRSRSRSYSRHKELKMKEPSVLDAFRVLYLTPSSHKKKNSKYLLTKKRQDHIEELLKSDGLGSKRWLFYPRNHTRSEILPRPPENRDNNDQRVKVDGNFFRKYKKSKKMDTDAPIAKLKRWELLFYKKIGFLRAV